MRQNPNEPVCNDWAELPLMLTVEDAARLLRIGRSHAYNLTTTYFASGGLEGIPAMRLGGVIRIPRSALIELMTTGQLVQLLPHATAPVNPTTSAARARRNGDRSQLSLLGSD